MRDDIYVEFYVNDYIENKHCLVSKTGVVVDKFQDTALVSQKMPSGNGGFLDISDFKIVVDYYLILGDDKITYRIRCKDVKIRTVLKQTTLR